MGVCLLLKFVLAFGKRFYIRRAKTQVDIYHHLRLTTRAKICQYSVLDRCWQSVYIVRRGGCIDQHTDYLDGVKLSILYDLKVASHYDVNGPVVYSTHFYPDSGMLCGSLKCLT